MENKNDVPEGHDPTAGEAERPLPSTPDSEVPEFLKGPDPDETDDAGNTRATDANSPADAASGPPPAPQETGQQAGMDRDVWEAEFSSTTGGGDTAEIPEPASGQHAADSDTTRVDGDTEAASVGETGRRDATLGTEDPAVDASTDASTDASADTTAYAATEAAPEHTRALPTWDQYAAAERRTRGPAGATAVTSGAAASAVADARERAATDPADTAATGTGSTSTDPGASDAAPADPKDGQRTDAVLAAKRRGGDPRPPGEDSDPDAQRRQNARDAALTAKPRFARVVQTVLAIFFPFLLVIGAIRAVASPWFLWLEYHRPGFPVDAYGFSPAERLTYGNYGVDYINNSAPSAYLGNLVDGKGDPLFLGTEVSHMADVKSVMGLTYGAGIVMAILAVLICLYLGRRYAGGIRRAFFAGAVITLVAMIAVTILAVLNFETFFTDFHELFFAQGNWTFHANDTLIRLYPTQFWMDAGIVIAGLVLLVSLIFLITNWPTRKRRERSRLRQGNRDLGLD